MSLAKITSNRSSAFAKNPAKWKARFSWARFAFIVFPLRIVFDMLERCMSGREKKYLLLVAPYAELDENTLYLFDEVRRDAQGGLRPVLFVLSKTLCHSLEARFPGAVVYAMSATGLKVFFSARLAFTSRGVLASAFYPYYFHPRHKIFINLWHGIPLKRINYLARGGFEETYRHERQPYHAITVASKLEQITMAASFRLGLDNVWITSTPRMDPLFRGTKAVGKASRNILYAPTYRDSAVNADLFPFADFDLKALHAFLVRNNARLIVRRHLFEKEQSVNYGPYADRIVFDDRGSLYDSLQQELLDTCILITDYSSIYLDFLALNRPIVFIPYDIADYEKKRGLMFEYDQVTPGPKATSFAELQSELQSYLDEVEKDAERRSSVRDMFHLYQDGRAVERILARANAAVNELWA